MKDSWCYLLETPYIYAFGVLLLLLILLLILRKRQPKSIVAYTTENGSVTIRRSAVVELVRTSCEQLNQITKPSLNVFIKKGLTHFVIRIQLNSGSRLKDVENTLQNHLRESLSQNLGIENLGDINIVVTSFKSSRIRPTHDTTPIPPTLTLPATEREYEREENPDEPDPEEPDSEKPEKR